MSRRRRSQAFWRDNVLHVPTSPFMSPVSSPTSSPHHSPLVSPPRTPPHSSSTLNEAPDVASVILNQIPFDESLTLEDVLQTWQVPQTNDEDEELQETKEDEIDEEEITPSSQSVDLAVQRAYDRFLQDVFHTEHTASLLTNLASQRDTSPPPPPPSAPLRPAPPPPTSRARDRNLNAGNLFVRRRPPLLRIPRSNNRETIVPLRTGGFTYAVRSPIIITRDNIGNARQLRRATSRADLPLVRQYAAEATRASRQRARRRIVRFSRQLVNREDNQNQAHQFTSSRDISSFQLTEDFGLPVDKCAICLEEYKMGDYVSYISCQPTNHTKDHMFHTTCISEWVLSLRRNGSQTRTCPVCRGIF